MFSVYIYICMYVVYIQDSIIAGHGSSIKWPTQKSRSQMYMAFISSIRIYITTRRECIQEYSYIITHKKTEIRSIKSAMRNVLLYMYWLQKSWWFFFFTNWIMCLVEYFKLNKLIIYFIRVNLGQYKYKYHSWCYCYFFNKLK